MILTYKYRLNLKKHQHKSLEKALEDSRILYNSALEERISAWKNNRINVSKFDHFQSLTQSYKAERAGGKVVEINPKNTSQTCSACSTIVKKDLKERVHQCDCGWTLDRDLNAAYNIEKKAFCSSLWLDQAIKNYKNRGVVIPEVRLDLFHTLDKIINQTVVFDVPINISQISN